MTFTELRWGRFLCFLSVSSVSSYPRRWACEPGRGLWWKFFCVLPAHRSPLVAMQRQKRRRGSCFAYSRRVCVSTVARPVLPADFVSQKTTTPRLAPVLSPSQRRQFSHFYQL